MKIMIVDDEENMRKILSMALSKEGHEVKAFASAQEGLNALADFRADLIVSDIKMDKMNGFDFIKNVRVNFGNIPVCFMTAYGTIPDAVEAMKLGAVDYLLKPFEIKALREIIEGCDTSSPGEGVPVGSSKTMRTILETAKKVAQTEATVLLKGETGAGKDLIARFIHDNSKRRSAPFVKVDCTSIPSDLFESELFGHKKGSFTGAISDRTGKFEAADKGTIFLDEIGTLREEMQKKFLRIIEEKVLVRIGESQERHVDIRIISATNEDLEELVKKGAFRKDLFFRLKNVEIFIPPLRERKEDLEELIRSRTAFLNAKYGMKKTIGGEAMQKLQGYSFPGNIRELHNIIEQAYILSDDDNIKAEAVIFSDIVSEDAGDTEMRLLEIEKKYIKKAIAMSGGNLSKAAKILGLNRNQLTYKIEKYSLNR